jgi:hypothetical protein
MQALFAHLTRVQLGHHGLKQRRDFVQPIGAGALGERETVMLALLA